MVLFKKYNRFIYAIPDGVNCLVIAEEQKTCLRDKTGYMLEVMSSWLPNGNEELKGSGVTVLQGIYNTTTKTVYLVDLLYWDNQIFMDYPAEHRLEILVRKVEENPMLGQISEHKNGVKFRIPQIMECTRQTLEKLYYGLYTRVNTPMFDSEYNSLLRYARSKDVLEFIKMTSEEFYSEFGKLKLCASFGFDNKNEPYLKDGLGFIHKKGAYVLGYNEATIQWKDALTSYNYDTMLKYPNTAYLFYNKDKRLVTHDGYIVEEDIDNLQINQTYIFSFDGIHVNEPYAVLKNLKLCKNSPRLVWSSITDILFRTIARNNLMPYQALVNELAIQEISKDKANLFTMY